MLPHLRIVVKVFILIFIIFTTQSQAAETKFPKLSELEIEFFQTEVSVTNEDQQVVAYATEYYDESGGGIRGRVDVLELGNRISIFYYNDTNEILEVNSTTCKAWGSDESIFAYEPLFYGWLNKEPLVIGPSAPFWYAEANRDKIVDIGETIVRDIKCDKFSINYTSPRDAVTYDFYFAAEDWTTPYQLEGLRVPIRIEVHGQTSRGVEDASDFLPINQYTDFAYFRPDIQNWRKFQPPEGIGCPLRKVTREIPKMPKVYHYVAEVVDLIKADNQEKSDVEYQAVWYDGINEVARLDKYTKLRSTSELYDFDTGVTYSMVDGRTCDIKPLRNSFFEAYDNQMIGHLKDPGEVLGVDKKFYYMGKKTVRGIGVDVFEGVKEAQTFMNKDLKKLVITIYYSDEHFEVAVDGETETRVPVFYSLKGWDDQQKVVINMQYNIFAFDDVIYPELYESFKLETCFPSVNDKSYFLMLFNVPTKELSAKMEENDDYIIEQLRAEISNYAKISSLRLPLMRADYTSIGVYVNGIMLDRPPALKQFWLEFEGNDASTNDPYLKVAPAANDLEKCAFACVDEDDFTCMGFFFCNQACFLKSKDILEPNEDNVPDFNFGEKCQEWLRAERESSNKEPYLKTALKSLEDAVLNSSIKVNVPIDNHAGKIVVVTDVIIGEGPYTGQNKQETNYDLVISFAKLDPNDETTEQLTYVDTLNDCYMACKRSSDLSCSSFSYCPDASNKQCSLSSVLVLDRKRNPDDTIDDKNCYVYSMKYLDYYQEYPGRISMIPGADILEGIKSPEECAKNCRLAKDISCRGFEYCYATNNCILHSKHVLDLKPGEVIHSDKKTSCVHYAARYAADYLDMGFTLIDDNSDVRKTLPLEDCAKICSEELQDKCVSFNYCPASSMYAADSSCALSSLTLTSPRITTTNKPPCHHYEKKSKVDDWGSSPKQSLVNTGYTTSGFTWLVVCMLGLGLALGAVGFVVYSYYRSRSSDQGMTVRFMKNQI